VGIGVTLLVQYSSVTASTLVQLAALGAIRIEQLYPLVIGANIGTALPGVISSISKQGTSPLQVALSHLFVNIASFLLWYPLPHTRVVITWPAQRLGHGAALWPYFPVLYAIGLYFGIPLLLIGLSVCFTHEGTAGVVMGCLMTVLFTIALIGLVYWCKFKGGDEKYVQWLYKHQNERQPKPQLPPPLSTGGGGGGGDVARAATMITVLAAPADISPPITTTTKVKDNKNSHDMETGGNDKNNNNNGSNIVAGGNNRNTEENNNNNNMLVVHGNNDDNDMGHDNRMSTLPESAPSAIHGTIMTTIREDEGSTTTATHDWDSASIETILSPPHELA